MSKKLHVIYRLKKIPSHPLPWNLPTGWVFIYLFILKNGPFWKYTTPMSGIGWVVPASGMFCLSFKADLLQEDTREKCLPKKGSPGRGRVQMAALWTSVGMLLCTTWAAWRVPGGGEWPPDTTHVQRCFAQYAKSGRRLVSALSIKAPESHRKGKLCFLPCTRDAKTIPVRKKKSCKFTLSAHLDTEDAQDIISRCWSNSGWQRLVEGGWSRLNITEPVFLSPPSPPLSAPVLEQQPTQWSMRYRWKLGHGVGCLKSILVWAASSQQFKEIPQTQELFPHSHLTRW